MPRIAVVGADPTVLELMAEMVGEHGWDMLPVQDGQTVNEVALHEQPDAVIFDFYPGTVNAARGRLLRLRTAPATASSPVIIWSSDPRQFDEQQEWLDAHAIPILSKPFELADLYAHLDLIQDCPAVLIGRA